MNYERRLNELGYALPSVTPIESIYTYLDAKPFGSNMLCISGTGGDIGDFAPRGRLGKDVDIATGQKVAEGCMLNILSVIKARYGSLDVIKSFVKLLCFVAGGETFFEQSVVANGATNFLVQVFGEEVGKPSRAAIGVYTLPENIPVEIECMVELKENTY